MKKNDSAGSYLDSSIEDLIRKWDRKFSKNRKISIENFQFSTKNFHSKLYENEKI